MAKNTVDLSVVLNIHRESYAMHSTLRSLDLACQYALRSKIATELILVLDDTDTETKQYLKQSLPGLFAGLSVKQLFVDNKDLGASRNDGCESARGTVVATVDADDLFSENLLYKGYQAILHSEEDIIVHPGYIVSFDSHRELWIPVDSDSPSFNRDGVVEYNPWPSLSFASKQVRKKHPYKITHVGEGFGPEDWQWNLDTLASGIDHKSIQGAAYYYRRKQVGSLAAAHHDHISLLYPTPLLQRLSSNSKKTELNNEEVSQRRTTKYLLKKTLAATPKGYKLEQAIHATLHKVRHQKNRSGNKPNAGLTPTWLYDDLKTQYEFDHKLYFTQEQLDTIDIYKPAASIFSSVYWYLLELIVGSDYVFIIPTLGMGGAEKVALNYINAIYQLKPHAKISVIATDIKRETRDIPPYINYIRLPKTFFMLDELRQKRLLGTVLIQAKVPTIHVIISTLGYWIIESCGAALSMRSKIFISLFGPDRVHREGNRRVHILLDNPFIARYLSGIFTDNRHTIEDFINWGGYPRNLFLTHYQPIDQITNGEKISLKTDSHEVLRILWAGRLDHQKRPDILMEIAKECKRRNLPVLIDVYGSAVLDTSVNYHDIIQSCKDLHYKGEFHDGIQNIPNVYSYDAFLLTSDYEGVPNALLEAIMCGMIPLVSNVGGVPEVVDATTGYLIENNKDIKTYVDAIESILDNRKQVMKKLEAAQSRVGSRHSWEHFLQDVKKSKNYLK